MVFKNRNQFFLLNFVNLLEIPSHIIVIRTFIKTLSTILSEVEHVIWVDNLVCIKASGMSFQGFINRSTWIEFLSLIEVKRNVLEIHIAICNVTNSTIISTFVSSAIPESVVLVCETNSIHSSEVLIF